MKKNKSKLPDFNKRSLLKPVLPDFNRMSYKEEAKWWDTHDLGNHWDEFEDVDIVFELDKPRRETIVLRVQESIKKNMERFARSRGLNLSTLVRMWIMEKLEENLRAGKKAAAGK